MAKKKSGDWRSPGRIRDWAVHLAGSLPGASPGTPVRHPARSLRRLLAYAAVGWALCTGAMAVLLQVVSLTAALVLHAFVAPVVFVALARPYFRARGARDPLATAATWTAVAALLDLVVAAGAGPHSLVAFRSLVGAWLPLALVFLATWATGEVLSLMPPAR